MQLPKLWLRNGLQKLILGSMVVATVSIFFLSRTSEAQASLSPALSSYEQQVVNLINAERKKAGVSPVLAMNEKLIVAARKHNDVMNSCASKYGAASCFLHLVTQMGEPKLMDRINQTGYNATSVGEIIAYGYKTPQRVVQGWMNSSGHKAIILSPERPDIGCGYLDGNNGDYKRLYWTCDFGKSSQLQQSLTPSSTPKPTTKATNTRTTNSTHSPTPTHTPRPNSSSSSPQTSTTSLPWWCQYIRSSSFLCKAS